MLRVEALSYGPDGQAPLRENLSFTLAPGESLQVRGGNGTGKSLLLRTLLGLHAPAAGIVDNAYERVGYLPQAQNPTTHLPFSLRDVALSCGRGRASELAELGLLPAEKYPLAWNRASGGERQRALLARTLLGASELLVLDEPFNHLDVSAVARTKEVLRARLSVRERPALLLVTHGSAPADWLPGALRVLDLDAGREVQP